MIKTSSFFSFGQIVHLSYTFNDSADSAVYVGQLNSSLDFLNRRCTEKLPYYFCNPHSLEISRFYSNIFWQKLRESNVFTKERSTEVQGAAFIFVHMNLFFYTAV